MLCTEMDDGFGLYRDGILVDRFVPEDNGPHRVVEYELVLGAGAGWRVGDVDALTWADCTRNNDWPGAVLDWKPGAPWLEWP